MRKRLLKNSKTWRDWEPEAGADPHTILHEALRATKKGHFDEALAKHIWFHEHALESSRSLFGVRGSYGVSRCVELSRQFEPAANLFGKEFGAKLRQELNRLP